MPKQTASKHLGRMMDMVEGVSEHIAYLQVDPEYKFDQTQLNFLRSTVDVMKETIILLMRFAIKKEK